MGARLARGAAAAPQHQLPRAGHGGPHLAGHERAARLRAQLPAVPALRLRRGTRAGLARAPGRACRCSTRRRRWCWCRCTGWGSSCSPRSRWWPAPGGATGTRASAATARARWRRPRRCASGWPGSRSWCWPCRGSRRSTGRAPARSLGAASADEPLTQIAAAGSWLLLALALGGVAVALARRPRARWLVFVLAVLASGAPVGRAAAGVAGVRDPGGPDGVGRGGGRRRDRRRAAHGDQGAQPPLLDAPVLPRAPEQRVRRQASF